MFGIFSSKKPFNAQINSATASFVVPAGDNLLNAALNSGLAWPHNCRVGSCGTCRCRLVSGQIKPLNDFSYVLDEDELDQGMILACQTRLRSDIEVDITLDESALSLAIPETAAGVISHTKPLTHDILEVRIELDNALPAYVAGQYAEVTVAGIDQPRSYSYACAPSREEPNQLTFFVRHIPGGAMSGWLHSENRVGQKVSVSGPHGTFYLREADTPILCIAGGSGLAPIKALLEQLTDESTTRQVTVLFGARTQKDLYCLEDMKQFCAANPDRISFVPVLSHEAGTSDWNGLRGLVTEFIATDSNAVQSHDLANSQAYMCGPPPMIDSAIDVLTKSGMAQNQIFFDKFLDASHLPGGKR